MCGREPDDQHPGRRGARLAVEGAQAIDIASRLGVEGNTILSTLLGSTFDPLDVVAYGGGLFAVLVVDIWLTGRRDAS